MLVTEKCEVCGSGALVVAVVVGRSVALCGSPECRRMLMQKVS